jgi:D-alanyl-D-alanine dipeptidase
MANESPKGLLDSITQLPIGLLDPVWDKGLAVDMDKAFKDLTVDMDSVIDDLSFRSSTHAGEVSDAYKKKTEVSGTGLLNSIKS